MYTSLPGCVGVAAQSDARIYFDWQLTLSHSSLSAPVANVPHKYTPIRFFFKVNNFDALPVI